MAFEFVDNAAIDCKARKLIRSHAATGKNVGQKRLPRRKQSDFRTRRIVTISRGKTDDEGLEPNPHCQEAATRIETPISDGLFVVCFPIDWTPSFRFLFHKVFCFISGNPYPTEVRKMIDFASGSIWVQNIFLDEAYFHCSVAMAAVATNSQFTGTDVSKEEILHLTRTFSLVNKKLSGAEALSDATLADIIGMSTYECIKGQHRKALVHFEGLRKIVELRGGIAHLTTHQPAIAQKIFRTDLECAIHLGSATWFSLGHIPGYRVLSSLRSLFGQEQEVSFRTPNTLDKLSLELQDLVLDIGTLSWLLNSGTHHRTMLDGYTFHDTIIIIGFRLVHISPLGGPRPTDDLENVVQLGLMSFMATFMRKLGGILPTFTLLADLSRLALQGHVNQNDDTLQILLWMLFIGRSSIFHKSDEIWLVPKLQHLKLALGLETWEDARQVVSQYPWINALHDKPGQDLWQTAHLYAAAP